MPLTKRAQRRLLFVLALLLTIVLAVVAVRQFRAVGRERVIEQYRVDGLAAYEAGDLKTALSNLSAFVSQKKDDPESVAVLLKFADVRFRLPKPDGTHLLEARGLYQHARRLLTDNPQLSDHDALLQETLERLLEIYGRMDMRPELLATADRLLTRDAGHDLALSARTWVLFREQRHVEAMESVQELVKLDPDDPNSRFLQLRIMAALNLPEQEMLEQCDTWIAEYEGDGRLHLLKAGWLAERGRVDQARASARDAVAQGAESIDVLQKLVSLLDLLQLRDEADRLLTDAATTFPDEPWVSFASARRRWHVGESDVALAEIRAAAATFDDPGRELRRLEAVVLMSLNRVDEARELLTQMQAAGVDATTDEAGIDAAWAEALLARLDMEPETWSQVIDTIHTAVSAAEADGFLFYLMGEVYARAGERALAVQALQRAVELEPNWLAGTIALGEALLDVGRAHEAFRVGQRLIGTPAEDRLDTFLLLTRASIDSRKAGGEPTLRRADTGDVVDIVELAQAMHDQYADRDDITVLLAEACCITGRPARAGRLMREAMQDGHSSSDLLVDLADLSRRYGLGLADQLVDAAIQRGGLEIRTALARATLLADQGRTEEGLHLIDRAIAQASATADDATLLRVRSQRAGYLLRVNLPGGMEEMRSLAADGTRSIDTLSFILAQTAAWDDEPLIRSTVSHLTTLLGAQATQVRLAEANYLLQFHGDDESRRASAIVEISNVLAEAPEDLSALILMARASLGGNNPSPQRAIEHFERAINVAPGRRSLYLPLIELLQKQGDFEAARSYLVRLGQLGGRTAREVSQELQLLYEQGDFDAALLRANELVDETSSVSSQLALATLSMRAGRTEDARAIYERLLRVEDPGSLLCAQAAEFYAVQGDLDRALEVLHGVGDEDGPAVRPMLIGTLYQRHDRPEEAEQWLRRAVEADPDSPDAYHQLAKLYVATGRLDDASKAASAGLAIDPDHTALRGILAVVSLRAGGQSGDRESALALLQELGVEQENAALLATVQLIQKIPVLDDRVAPHEAHLEEARRLVEDYPQFQPAWQLAISLHRDAGQVQQTIDLARRAVSRFTTDPQPAEWATVELIRAARWEEALIEAREWRRRSLHDSERVDAVIAGILLELRRPADAATQLQEHAARIVERRAIHPDRFVAWITALAMGGRLGEAWDTLQPIVLEDDGWSLMWLGLSTLVPEPSAMRILELYEPVAIQAGPRTCLNTAEAYCGLGKRFGSDICFDRAEALLDPLSEVQESRLDVLSLDYMIAEHRGDFPRAEGICREMLRIAGDNPRIHNNLAYLLSRDPQTCEQALPHIEQALELMPDQPDFLDTYAHVLMGLNRLDEAGTALNTAQQARPDDVGIMLSRVELFLRHSDTDNAQLLLREARAKLSESIVLRPALDEKIRALTNQILEVSNSEGG